MRSLWKFPALALLFAAALGAQAGTIYQVAQNGTAFPLNVQDINYYGASPGGQWRLLNDGTISFNFGPGRTIGGGFGEGETLVSLGTSTSSAVWGRSDAGFLYQIDQNGTAFRVNYQDISYYSASLGGQWRLLDDGTISFNYGPGRTIGGAFGEGETLVSLSTSTSSAVWARSDAGFLYQVDQNGTAFRVGYQDISYYSASPGGQWRLLDDGTVSFNFGPGRTVGGALPEGETLNAFHSSTSSAVFATAAVPEPTYASLLLGVGTLVLGWRRLARRQRGQIH